MNTPPHGRNFLRPATTLPGALWSLIPNAWLALGAALSLISSLSFQDALQRENTWLSTCDGPMATVPQWVFFAAGVGVGCSTVAAVWAVARVFGGDHATSALITLVAAVACLPLNAIFTGVVWDHEPPAQICYIGPPDLSR
jgi:hypothetical protein